MNQTNLFKNTITTLLSGDPSPVEDINLFLALNENISYFIENNNRLNENEVEVLGDIIHLANIIYNNIAISDDDLFIDNGVYDLLLEKYRYYNPNVQVGAEPIVFQYQPKAAFIKKNTIQLVKWIDVPVDDMLYFDSINPIIPINKSNQIKQLVTYLGDPTGKKLRVTPHGNPSLVGTLDKCKFVLDKQAEKAGVLDDPKVKVLERDFFGKHFEKDIIDPNMIIRMIAELKYDGVSVVVTVRNSMVISAISRGDTGMDAAVDYTPIFYGYMMPDIPADLEMDIKCEAVMTYKDLLSFNEVRGYEYKNARSAIIGLTGLNDGYKYRDFITLVPLKVAHSTMSDNPVYYEDMFKDRIEEAEFINLFCVTKEPLRYSYIEGNFVSVLFQIKKFVEEAEMMRPYMNVMYDGVVISYLDKDIINSLGREDSVNKYSVAVKFPTLKRLTRLLGVSYTIGQNGVITPMAHYQPIEFIGTVHTKSSISSVKRFNENHFKIGNTIQVEYINDVMPYVTTPKEVEEINNSNPAPEIQFVTHCPACGEPLSFTEKSATCTNIKCNGRVVARMANMMDKLGIKGFAEETMRKLEVKSLSELLSISKEEIAAKINSDILAGDLVTAINILKTTPMYDYIIIGALGFTDVAQGTWKKIFHEITLADLICMYYDKDGMNKTREYLIGINGIGKATADTIINEIPLFIEDIREILLWDNTLVDSKGISQLKIRVSGFRDPELMKVLCDMGYDASDKSVTKDTFILLIPSEGYTSSKLKKVGPDTKIIPVNEFKNNMEKYL